MCHFLAHNVGILSENADHYTSIVDQLLAQNLHLLRTPGSWATKWLRTPAFQCKKLLCILLGFLFHELVMVAKVENYSLQTVYSYA